MTRLEKKEDITSDRRVTLAKMVTICSEQTYNHVLHALGRGYIKDLNTLYNNSTVT